MIRVFAAVLGLLVVGSTSAAMAQAPASAAPQTVALVDEHAAKVAKLVDGACGPAPKPAASAGDKEIYAQCRALATPRAEAMVH